MKTFWRISKYADLSGEGGRIASARWHTQGSAIVYLAESPAGAMLEHLVHLLYTRLRLPATYDLLEVRAPDELAVKDLMPLAEVGWRENLALTRRIGDAWLASGETALARTPSAVMPRTWNVLLNPAHPEAAQVRVQEVIRERFDNRLFRLGAQ